MRNIRAITKEMGTEHVTHCDEQVPVSTCTVSIVRRPQDFTKRLLFINLGIHELKGKSVVQTSRENRTVSWDWYLHQECHCS